jgi:hypothetical protein
LTDNGSPFGNISKHTVIAMSRAVVVLCLFGAAVAEQQVAYQDPASVEAAQSYYQDPAQELLYQRRQGIGGGFAGPGVGQADAALLLPSILPSLLLLTLGALGAAYFSARLDVIEKETAERLHYLEDAIDTRLDRLEDEVKEGQKIDKKNDFKTKALCKLAGLFNNPLYDICQEGFDSTQIIGPSGHGGDGLQQF